MAAANAERAKATAARSAMAAQYSKAKAAGLAQRAAQSAWMASPETIALSNRHKEVADQLREYAPMGPRWRNLNLMYIQALAGGPAYDAYMQELSSYNAQSSQRNALQAEMNILSKRWQDMNTAFFKGPETLAWRAELALYNTATAEVATLERAFKDKFTPVTPQTVALRLDPTPANIDSLAGKIVTAQEKLANLSVYQKTNKPDTIVFDILKKSATSELSLLIQRRDTLIESYQTLPSRPGEETQTAYETTKQRINREKAYIASLEERARVSQNEDLQLLWSGQITRSEYDNRVAYREQIRKFIFNYRGLVAQGLQRFNAIGEISAYIPTTPPPVLVVPPTPVTPVTVAPVVVPPDPVLTPEPVPAPQPEPAPTPVAPPQPLAPPEPVAPTAPIVPPPVTPAPAPEAPTEPIATPAPAPASEPALTGTIPSVVTPEPVVEPLTPPSPPTTGSEEQPAVVVQPPVTDEPVQPVVTPVAPAPPPADAPVVILPTEPIAPQPPTTSPDAPQPPPTIAVPDEPVVPVVIPPPAVTTPEQLQPPTIAVPDEPVVPEAPSVPERTLQIIYLDPVTGYEVRDAQPGETQASFDASGVVGSKTYQKPNLVLDTVTPAPTLPATPEIVELPPLDDVEPSNEETPYYTTRKEFTRSPTVALLDYNTQVTGYQLPTGQSSQSPLTPVPKDASYVDPELATVEGRTANLLKSGNPLLEQAKVVSQGDYNKRGLLNSGGAVQAGVGATMDKALQIATPDAALYGNMAQASQKTGLEGSLNNQLAEIERKKYENNALITGSLAQQDIRGRKDIQTLADNAAIQRLQLENEWKDYLSASQFDSAETQALMQSAGAMGQELTGSIERLLRDTNIVNKTDAINALMVNYKAQLNTVAATAGIALEWS